MVIIMAMLIITAMLNENGGCGKASAVAPPPESQTRQDHPGDDRCGADVRHEQGGCQQTGAKERLPDRPAAQASFELMNQDKQHGSHSFGQSNSRHVGRLERVNPRGPAWICLGRSAGCDLSPEYLALEPARERVACVEGG